MVSRVDRLQAEMTRAGIGHMLIQKPKNMRYLTGYTGEGALLVSQSEAVILTDFRYVEQATIQSPGTRVVQYGVTHPMLGELRALLEADAACQLAIEEDEVSVEAYRGMQEKLGGVEMISAGGITEQLRMTKDEDEIDCVRRACEISCKAFEEMVRIIKAGMTEREIQLQLDYTMLRLGADGLAFDTIACAGVNGSLPHAIPGSHALREGELLTLDFGARYGGYCADMTRTLAIGQVSSQLKDIYYTVLEAQTRALQMVGPGVECSAVDKCARDFIDARYPGAFGHGLGHGVGLDIHEQPVLNARDHRELRPGHIVTVEPGVYIPGLGGCRIEDTVVVTENGFDNLIDAPKNLIVL